MGNSEEEMTSKSSGSFKQMDVKVDIGVEDTKDVDVKPTMWQKILSLITFFVLVAFFISLVYFIVCICIVIFSSDSETKGNAYVHMFFSGVIWAVTVALIFLIQFSREDKSPIPLWWFFWH